METLFRAVRVFDGSRFLDGPRDVLVRGGVVHSVAAGLDAGARVHKPEGGMLLPGFVDAHVHLSFADPAVVAAGGVTTVLDLGAPLAYVRRDQSPLTFRFAGPLITSPGGYPTRSWGSRGYGLEVRGPQEARDAVTLLADMGATVVKVAIEPAEGPVPDTSTLSAAVSQAHSIGLRVAAHALDASSVRKALDAGADLLAHMPVDELPDDVISELARRGTTIISTVRAFGAAPETMANLRRLVEAGVPVVYGTDLGNGPIRPGIDVLELQLLAEALGGMEAALASATSGAGALAGSGGTLAPGERADLVWVPKLDRMQDLASSKKVWIGGRLVA
ncbi:MAG TPA: amidohydrolase family protein [Actinomycetota bacterium]|nr:amidohydrolase family protein [Actinomycetota bacterium]